MRNKITYRSEWLLETKIEVSEVHMYLLQNIVFGLLVQQSLQTI
jgi:hypothetical protein